FFIAVAERRTPKPGHAFDVGLAVRVIDIDPLRPLDDERSRFAEAGEIDVRMHQRFYVAGGQIAERRHGILVFRWGAFARERRRTSAALMPSWRGWRKPLSADEGLNCARSFCFGFFRPATRQISR